MLIHLIVSNLDYLHRSGHLVIGNWDTLSLLDSALHFNVKLKDTLTLTNGLLRHELQLQYSLTEPRSNPYSERH